MENDGSKKEEFTSEQELIDSLAKMIRAKKVSRRTVILGIGDDTAVVRPDTSHDLLITTDIQVEGKHFQRAWFTGYELGWRLAAVNLSDIAAMGGRPLYGVVSLAFPSNVQSIAYVKEIERGARDHLARYGASIVGGNVSGSDEMIICDLTLIGATKKGKAWKRKCNAGGDAIVVVGYLGDARAGFEILKFAPRGAAPFKSLIRSFKKPQPLLDVARLLTEENAVCGAIDVSDGFSTDLVHLCRASGTGCEVDAATLPVSRALERFCKERGENVLDWALRGGEDYALILSTDSAAAPAIAELVRKRLGKPASVVGRFTRRKGRYELIVDGHKRVRLEPQGWNHLVNRH